MRHKINKVWTDAESIYASTEDGLTARYSFSLFNNLRNATDEQRKSFTLSRYGIHWEDLDEDISFEGMFYDSGLCPITMTEDSVYY